MRSFRALVTMLALVNAYADSRDLVAQRIPHPPPLSATAGTGVAVDIMPVNSLINPAIGFAGVHLQVSGFRMPTADQSGGALFGAARLHECGSVAISFVQRTFDDLYDDPSISEAGLVVDDQDLRVSWSCRLRPVSIGLSWDYVESTVLGTVGRGMRLGAGALVSLERFTIGVAANHWPKGIEWRTASASTWEENLPVVLALGASALLLQRGLYNLRVAADAATRSGGRRDLRGTLILSLAERAWFSAGRGTTGDGQITAGGLGIRIADMTLLLAAESVPVLGRRFHVGLAL